MDTQPRYQQVLEHMISTDGFKNLTPEQKESLLYKFYDDYSEDISAQYGDDVSFVQANIDPDSKKKDQKEGSSPEPLES